MNNSQIYERFVSRMSKIGLTRVRRAKAFLGGEKEAFDKANDELENIRSQLTIRQMLLRK